MPDGYLCYDQVYLFILSPSFNFLDRLFNIVIMFGCAGACIRSHKNSKPCIEAVPSTAGRGCATTSEAIASCATLPELLWVLEPTDSMPSSLLNEKQEHVGT